MTEKLSDSKMHHDSHSTRNGRDGTTTRRFSFKNLVDVHTIDNCAPQHFNVLSLSVCCADFPSCLHPAEKGV